MRFMTFRASVRSRATRTTLLALATAAVPLAAAAQTDAGTYRASSEVNLRAAPGIDGELLGVIPVSAQVTVFACDSFGWCQVRYQDLDGWAARQFLVRTGDLAEGAFALRFGEAATAEGPLELDGTLTPGSPCATLRTEDGTEYAIVGNVGFGPGDPLHVVGVIVQTDACGTATALSVAYVRLDP